MPKKDRAILKEEFWRNFGLRLKRAREGAGYTQQQVADGIGIHPVQLSRIENGESGTKRETIVALAEFIGVDKEAMLGWAGLKIQSDEITQNGFDESEFALYHSKIEKLTPQQKRDFYIFWNAAKDYVDQKERENRESSNSE